MLLKRSVEPAAPKRKCRKGFCGGRGEGCSREGERAAGGSGGSVCLVMVGGRGG
jgi:hypothetical protein